MMILLASVGVSGRKVRSDAETLLIAEYTKRATLYGPCALRTYQDADDLLLAIGKERKRQAVRLVLLDSSGEEVRSEELAGYLRRSRDGGVQQLVFAIGPADGWARDTLARADLVLSLSRMTLPHRLAQVVLAEQIYRALTIIAGHPYHCGH